MMGINEWLKEMYKGKNVLVTGGCGFKGSYLCYWLTLLGANVINVSRGPESVLNHYELLGLKKLLKEDLRMDLRQDAGLLKQFQVDLVFHLAANAIVAKTFENPAETFDSNVMGAVRILDACRQMKGLKGVVIVTTDKIYFNREWNYAYRENDELGDTTPYGASKVCVEQVVKCYRKHYFPNIAVARAGNVIGGGDWSYARLIPDLVRAAAEGRDTKVHTPYATRPWQHVLDPLFGYLLLGVQLMAGNENVNREFNFGPNEEMTVEQVINIASGIWPEIDYEVDEVPTHPAMVYKLKIDSTEAEKVLGWKVRWNMTRAIQETILWYKRFYEDKAVITKEQIMSYGGAI